MALLYRSADLAEASSLAQLLSLPLALLGCLLAFLTLLPSGRSGRSGAENLAQVVDQVAVAVQGQWEAEVDVRRLRDPDLLPISWEPAGSGDFWGLDEARSLAARWPSAFTGDPSEWAATSQNLFGTDSHQLAKTFWSKVPTRRIVMLGEGGAGKSVMLIQLILELIADRQAGDPVPVLIQVSSWDPSADSFAEWVEKYLVGEYAGLREGGPGSNPNTSRARVLFDARKLVLVVDGFDELSSGSRNRAITEINKSMRDGQALVLASRSTEYENAVRDSEIPQRIIGAVGFRLQPLDPVSTIEYLKRDAGTPAGAARWNQVVTFLGHGAPVERALQIPLLAALLRTIYNPRPGESTQGIPEPKELRDFHDFGLLEQYLFEAFIPAAYRHDQIWRPEQAERWLAFLAAHLSSGQPPGEIRWWEVHKAAPSHLSGTAVGLLTGTVAGVVAWVGGAHLGAGIGAGLLTAFVLMWLVRLRGGNSGSLVAGFAGGALGGLIGAAAAGWVEGIVQAGDKPSTIGLIGGVEVGLAIAPLGRLKGALVGGLGGGAATAVFAGTSPGVVAGVVDGVAVAVVVGATVHLEGRRIPSRGLRGLQWSPMGLLAGGFVGLAVGLSLGSGADLGIMDALISGTIAGLATGLVAGLEGAPAPLAELTSPAITLGRDRGTFWMTGLMTALALGLTVGLGIQLSVGLAAGLGYGLTVAYLQAATGAFAASRLWLAVTRRLPLRLMTFLDDAHRKRGALRQIGAVYEFRHVELQKRLASQSQVPGQETGSSSGPGAGPWLRERSW